MNLLQYRAAAACMKLNCCHISIPLSDVDVYVCEPHSESKQMVLRQQLNMFTELIYHQVNLNVQWTS